MIASFMSPMIVVMPVMIMRVTVTLAVIVIAMIVTVRLWLGGLLFVVMVR